eukprot:2722340-Amphidinium_carterae.1
MPSRDFISIHMYLGKFVPVFLERPHPNRWRWFIAIELLHTASGIGCRHAYDLCLCKWVLPCQDGPAQSPPKTFPSLTTREVDVHRTFNTWKTPKKEKHVLNDPKKDNLCTQQNSRTPGNNAF